MSQSLEELTQKAVCAALANDWEQAALLNKQILIENPDDIDTLNRLANSLLQKGDFSQAQKIYRKALHLDPYNPIAQKNIKHAHNQTAQTSTVASNPNLFLEEPGKTKIIRIETEPLARKGVRIGDEAYLAVVKKELCVCMPDKSIIGTFDRDFGAYLGKLLKIGNRYRVHIFSLEDDEVKVFLREIKRSKEMKECVPFPTAGSRQYRSFLKEDLLALLSDQSELGTPTDEEFEGKEITEEISFDENEPLNHRDDENSHSRNSADENFENDEA